MSLPSVMPMPKLQFCDTNGIPLANGKLYTYQPGTTTPMTTYTDSTGQVQNSNPVVLDSAGRASVWITGPVRIQCYDVNSNLQFDQDNVTFIGVPGSIRGVPWVDAASQGTFASTISALGTANNATVWVTSPVTVTDNLTIPVNISLEVLNTGSITISTGKILTINGSFMAGSYQVFYGSGTVTFASTSTANISNIWYDGATVGIKRIAGSKVALTPGATVSVSFDLGNIFTLIPGQSCQLNATGGTGGQTATIVITTSGTSSWTLTFGTNFKSTGTLATGTVSAKVFTISFAYDGTNWNEVARTTAM